MEMVDGLDDVYKYNRFAPSAEEAIAYYLPRLIAGDSTLHGAEKLIHHADIYSCEPKDLAYHYAPAPQAVSTGDRFFFTTCRRKNGSRARSARVAGAGTWTVNKTKIVYNRARAKVGEVKNFSFKKGDACTGWVMEEYSCLLPEALVTDGEMVLCKIHLSPSASAATRQESAAYMMRRQEPAEPPVPEPADAFTVATNEAHVVQKRPAEPVAAADLSSSKRMRMTAPVPTPDEEYQDCPDWSFAPAPPVSSPAAAGSAPAEAEDNMDESSSFKRMRMADPVPAPEEEYQDCPDWSFAPAAPVSSPVAAGSTADEVEDNMSCTLEELLGPQEEESKEQDENNTQQSEPLSDWDSGDLEEMERLLADGEDDQEERYAKEVEEFMAGIDKWCNNATVARSTDVTAARSTDGWNQFFSFATVN